MMTHSLSGHPVRWACSLALFICTVGAHSAPLLYRIAKVPQPAGQTSCRGVDLSDKGHVIGRCNGVTYIWSSAAGVEIFSDPKFPNALMLAAAVNNAGVVAGMRYDSTSHRDPGFIWDSVSGFTYFGRRDRFWDIRSINDSSQVLGNVSSDDMGSKAFTWSALTGVEYLKPLGNRHTFAFDINSHGQAAGGYIQPDGLIGHALQYEPTGEATRVATGGRNSLATAVNSFGHMAGYLRPRGGTASRAFVWTTEGGTIGIDPRTGEQDYSLPFDINDSDQVVGAMTWVDSNGQNADAAFYWDAGNGMLDLFKLIDPNDPLLGEFDDLDVFEGVLRINVHGQILVDGHIRADTTAILILTPLP